LKFGDQIRVKYLDGNKNGKSDEVLVKLSSDIGNFEKGIIGVNTSLGKAIYGSEEGDTVEMLAGPYIRKVKILQVIKNNN